MNRKHRLYSDKEKQELLDCIESSGGPIREALARLGLPKSTYYDWKNTGEVSVSGAEGQRVHPRHRINLSQ